MNKLEKENTSLKKENECFKSEIEELKRRIENKKQSDKRIISFLSNTSLKIAAGKNLLYVTKAWLKASIEEKKLPIDETSELFVAIIQRVIRIGFIGLLISMLPILILFSQTILLSQQNQSIREQINLQKTQTESIRKAQLVETIYDTSKANKVRREAISAFLDLEKTTNSGTKDSSKIVSLSEIDLTNANLAYMDLSNVVFADALLDGVDFSYATLDNAQFTRAKLRSAKFYKAKLKKAGFLFADVKGSNFYKAQLHQALFKSANIDGAYFYRAQLQGADFRTSGFEDLNRSWVYSSAKTTARKADFTEAVLVGVDLAYVQLDGANFNNADLSYSNLDYIGNWKQITNLEGAILSSVKNAPEGFIKWAKENGAIVTEDKYMQ